MSTTQYVSESTQLSDPVIEIHLQEAAAALARLFAVAAELTERDSSHLSDRAKERLCNLVPRAEKIRGLLLGQDLPIYSRTVWAVSDTIPATSGSRPGLAPSFSLPAALSEAHSSALVARAFIYGALRYDDSIPPQSARLLEQATEMLEHARRMLALHNPDTD